MPTPPDYSSMTIDELRLHQEELNRALTVKNDAEHLKGLANKLVEEAHSLGFAKAKVLAAFSTVVDQYYGA